MNEELISRAMPHNPVPDMTGCKEDYKRTKQSYLKDYEINIRFLSKGVIVRVGCKEIAFSSVEKAMVALNAYIENPGEEGKSWMAILD